MKTTRNCNRSFSIFLSTLYFFCFLYHLFFQYFTFSPIISIARTTEYSEEYYFENDLGGLLWDCEQREKIMFYLNDWNGNCSTKIGYLRQIQKSFPEYFLIQLDYPGYGYSAHMDLSIEHMIEKCGESISNYVKKNKIKKYGLWGEGIGNMILSKVIKRFKLRPDVVIHYNVEMSIFDYLDRKYSILSYLFFFIRMNMEDYSKTFEKEKPNIYIIYNEERKYKKNTYQYYYELKNIPYEKRNIISLEGKGQSTFFITNNMTELQKKIV